MTVLHDAASDGTAQHCGRPGPPFNGWRSVMHLVWLLWFDSSGASVMVLPMRQFHFKLGRQSLRRLQGSLLPGAETHMCTQCCDCNVTRCQWQEESFYAIIIQCNAIIARGVIAESAALYLKKPPPNRQPGKQWTQTVLKQSPALASSS
jgi:hypothetical protein